MIALYFLIGAVTLSAGLTLVSLIALYFSEIVGLLCCAAIWAFGAAVAIQIGKLIYEVFK